jgi:hypothetical protein
MTLPTSQPIHPTESKQQKPTKRPGASLWALRIVLLLHAGLVGMQPILAGYFLSGEADAMNIHGPIGSSLWMVSMLQLVVAVLYWRRGGRLWPALLTVALLIAEVVQLAMGYAQNLAVHIPLGTAIVATVVTLTIWSFRPGARRGRLEVAK